MGNELKFCLVFSLFFSLFSLAVFAQENSPQLPELFYGNAQANSVPVPAGSVITARVNGEDVGSITTTEAGKYGGQSSTENKLLVQGNFVNGQVIEFFLFDLKADQTVSFQSGIVLQKNLTWSFPAVTRSSNGTIQNQTDFLAPGQNEIVSLPSLTLNISSDIAINVTINNVTPLGSDFFTGTFAVSNGTVILNSYEINITGNVSVQVTFSYNATGIDESTITPVKFNGTSWIQITSFSIDTVAKTVTFTIFGGSTPYAIFSMPPAQTSTSTVSPSSGPSSGKSGFTTTTTQIATATSITSATSQIISTSSSTTSTSTPISTFPGSSSIWVEVFLTVVIIGIIIFVCIQFLRRKGVAKTKEEIVESKADY